MATIIAIGHKVPFVLPLGAKGFVYVHAHVFHVRFRFSLHSIVVEEKLSGDSSILKEFIFQSRYNDHESFYWLFHAWRYRVYGISSELLVTSIEIPIIVPHTSSVKYPLVRPVRVKSPSSAHSDNAILINLQGIKCEFLEPLIELPSSDYEGIQTVVETSYDTLEWHIAKILHKSKKRCHAIQNHTQAMCKLLVVRHGKPRTAPTYKGQRHEYNGTIIDIEEFWFCLDQIVRYIMGP